MYLILGLIIIGILLILCNINKVENFDIKGEIININKELNNFESKFNNDLANTRDIEELLNTNIGADISNPTISPTPSPTTFTPSADDTSSPTDDTSPTIFTSSPTTFTPTAYDTSSPTDDTSSPTDDTSSPLDDTSGDPSPTSMPYDNSTNSNMEEVLDEVSKYYYQNSQNIDEEDSQCNIIPSNGNNICPADNNFFRGYTKCNIREQAQAYPIIKNGKIINVLMIKHGKSYNKNVLIILKNSGRGRGCKLQPEICNGEIIKINVVNPGINYSENTKLIVNKPNNTDCKICCNYPYNQNL
jgi:hypothetical protein